MTKIFIVTDHTNSYVFSADTAEHALDMYAEQPGYKNFADLAETLSQTVEEAAADLKVEQATADELALHVMSNREVQAHVDAFNDSANDMLRENPAGDYLVIEDFSSLRGSLEGVSDDYEETRTVETAVAVAEKAGVYDAFVAAMDQRVADLIATLAADEDIESVAFEAAASASVGIDGDTHQIELTAEHAEKLGIQRMISAKQAGADWFRVEWAMADGTDRFVEYTTSSVDALAVAVHRLANQTAQFALELVAEKLTELDEDGEQDDDFAPVDYASFDVGSETYDADFTGRTLYVNGVESAEYTVRRQIEAYAWHSFGNRYVPMKDADKRETLISYIAEHII